VWIFFLFCFDVPQIYIFLIIPFFVCFFVVGTPIQNNLEELYAVVQFTAPGFLGTLQEFKVIINIAINIEYLTIRDQWSICKYLKCFIPLIFWCTARFWHSLHNYSNAFIYHIYLQAYFLCFFFNYDVNDNNMITNRELIRIPSWLACQLSAPKKKE
jgi:hypothetical protein